MPAHLPTAEDGRAALVMFARGDRVFPVDDLGGGIWSRRGTVLAVHASGGREPARATVLWDDGTAEVMTEDQLCLVYDQEAPIGIRVVTLPMAEPVDVVQHGGHVILVLRDGLLAPADVEALRDKLRRVRAALTPLRTDRSSVAELRRRDLDLLRALIAQLTGGAPEPR
jgi:hypothetical protein